MAAAMANPDASVSTLIAFNGSKCTRVGAVVKASISARKASCAASGHSNGPFFFPFLLPLRRSVISAATLA